MNDYSQPEFYRFNSDSIFLINFILQKQVRPQRILDMGAGCGIIGIELSRSLSPLHLTLLELQVEFKKHLELNINCFLPKDVSTSIVFNSFSDWKCDDVYDLIVSNPPYFSEGRGRQSLDPRRSIARSFLKDDWAIFVSKIEENLSKSGSAYLVLRKDQYLKMEIEKECIEKGMKVVFLEFDQLWIIEFSHLD